MKRDNMIEQLKQYAELLVSEKTDIIDFDALIRLLTECSTALSEHILLCEQYTILCDDIILRISGMEKAIAAVSNNKPDTEYLTFLLDEVCTYNAEQLLQQYRKSQARFKDAFPTSFGVLQNRKSKQDLSIYK